MIDLAAVAAKINALEGWSADEWGSDEPVDSSRHYVTVLKEWEGWEAIVLPTGEVVDGTIVDDFMLWLPVLQIVAEAMAHE